MKAAMGRLFAAVPILGFGPIGWLVTAVATLFGDKLYEGLRLAVSLELIALRNDAHRKAYVDAALNLRQIAETKGMESPDYKRAREAHREALARFVRFAP